MTETTTAPSPRPATRAARPIPSAFRAWEGLRVGREDISFVTLRPGVLLAEVTVRNAGPGRTGPAPAVLQSAPLGAFVPWQPLAVFTIPSLAPGESTVLRGEYHYEKPRALGTPDKLPPDRVLTALGLGGPNPGVPRGPTVAQDLLALLGQGSVHWAGNFNLFFPGKDVERHAAAALRVKPGCTNLADFIVGGTRPDEYQLRLTGDAGEWNARLFDTVFGRPITDGLNSAELQQGIWYTPGGGHTPGFGIILLAVQPPAGATAGAVNVHVRQRSTDREAVVEFTMDTRAAGPGCFTL
jgi:hypothetical protein